MALVEIARKERRVSCKIYFYLELFDNATKIETFKYLPKADWYSLLRGGEHGGGNSWGRILPF
jgi:hypothetical protein